MTFGLILKYRISNGNLYHLVLSKSNFDYDTSFNIIGIKIFNEIKKAYNIDEIIQFLENSVLRNDIGIIKKQKKLLDRLNLSNPKCVPACENIYNFIIYEKMFMTHQLSCRWP